ncbi:hypothetical protein FNV68_20160 [Streptomyces sp. S1D4-23]|nr:hypothetical protein FNV61_19160 [Streptomyces sp. RLB3-6]QDO08271.1 hypothetical protein FNV68_20160 [Streptomyces sp. S1D4-23]
MNPGTWASVERGRCPQGGLPGLARARAEDFDFWNPGCQEPFAEWLWKRLGRHSSLGWAAEIEREAEASNTPAVELFFSLLDEYRAERGQPKG